MKRQLRLLIAGALGAALLLATQVTSAQAASEQSRSRPGGEPVDIVVTGFDRPESVVHDVKRDVYLVSNITNGPRDTDNTGFISRLAPDGQILDLKFIEGGVNGVTLNAPKGSTVTGNVLYVADIDHLRRFDAATGAPLGDTFFPGATFLNDVASDRFGNVYVGDIGFTTVPTFGPSGTDAIYKVTPDGTVTTVAAGNDLLHHPNGIAVEPNGKLRVATYDPFDGTSELYTIDKRGRKSDVVTLPTGLLDGVVVLGRDVLVSSWVDFSNATAGVIYRVRPNGRATVIASGFQNASDIGFDYKRDRLLIPELPDPGTGGRVTIRILGR